MTNLVSLVLVSHSEQLAQGAAELAGQMAPKVRIEYAGGLEDGSLGTSFDDISAAIEAAAGFSDTDDDETQSLHEVVVICDLGSAILSTESVLEFLPEELVGKVTLADAPFVEGAIAAAVTANSGASAADVTKAGEDAANIFGNVDKAKQEPKPTFEPSLETKSNGPVTAQVTVANELGLHARPAAVLARLVAEYSAEVEINGINGASVLEIMKLGAVGGDNLSITAKGAQAAEVVAAVVDAITQGFGELAPAQVS